MSAGFASSVEEFLKKDKEHVIGNLTSSLAATGIELHRSNQIKVWGEQVDLLKYHLRNLLGKNPSVQDWYILLEYELPRRQKRPDVIFLARDVIIVLEFKVGAKSFDAPARWQTKEYALNLRDFHAQSANRSIVPILCATQAKNNPPDWDFNVSRSIANVQLSNAENLGDCLLRSFESAHCPAVAPISAEEWLHSPYRPTPNIIEAAVRLYERHDVREITHNYAENLDKTTDMLAEVIRDSKANGKHTICFITGVPGAGKTLTGLNVVHDPSFRSETGPSGIFLSGNGPLVKIIREALVENQMMKGRRRHDCKHEVSTFIQNVHGFLRYHRENPEEPPHENVVVFDEAQRAWNRKQMKRKNKIDESEPTLLLEVMERSTDWAVIIALVGGGQEIFLGEAGLEEWGRALSSTKKRWSIVASPEVLTGGTSVAGHRLFESGIPSGLEFNEEPLAHLKVSVRSHRAQLIAEWVNDLLEPNAAGARSKCPDLDEFPIVLTRNLDDAREWLRQHSKGDPNSRWGLVTSSEDQRLRAYGLENSTAFRRGYQFEKWFLAPPSDVRSSYALEVSATEFECQGLELDWVGLCWGGDLVPSEDGKHWIYRKFHGSKWKYCRSLEEQSFMKNRYRVLLTRARSGMVIWVPAGSQNDPTRDPRLYDRVYAHLIAAGVPEMRTSEDSIQ